MSWKDPATKSSHPLRERVVWLVTNYQAWVVGVLLFGDPHVWYRRYSFFEILALCKDAGTAPATRRKNFLVFEFLMQHLLWL